MARPRKEVDPDQVTKLAAIMCTLQEIADILGCSTSLLMRRFADPLKKGRALGTQSLRRWQYEAAEKGNVAMLIWLGKQYLGQSEKFVVDDGTGFEFVKE